MDKNLPETLRAQLDTVTYNELALAVRAKSRAAEQAGYLRALNDRAKTLKAVDTLRGALKSKLAALAGLMILFPEYWPQIQAKLVEVFGDSPNAMRVIQILGVVVFVLRLRTNGSLADKVSTQPAAAPGSQA